MTLLRDLHLTARGERLAELEGRRQRLFDSRGFHSVSYLCGQIEMLESLSPAVREVGAAEPNYLTDIRHAAVEDAQAIFAKRVREGKQKWQ